MNDIPYIGLVYSHTECIRCYDYRLSVINKVILIFSPLLCFEPCMIPGHCNMFPQEFQIQQIHIFPCCTVYDSAFCNMFPYIYNQPVLFFPRFLHSKIEVTAIKSGHQNFRLMQFQNRRNIFLDCDRSRCRKGTQYRSSGKFFDKRNDFKITWSEVLSPLRNAMCLIYRNHCNIRFLCKKLKSSGLQSLGCNIYNFITSLRCQLKGLRYLSLCQCTVNIGRMYPRFIECLHLILHQRNQG